MCCERVRESEQAPQRLIQRRHQSAMPSRDGARVSAVTATEDAAERDGA